MKRLWNDRYFWLVSGICFSAVAIGEIATVRIFQHLIGMVKFAQPVTLAVFATLTAGIGALCKMRAIIISSPKVGHLFLALCILWTVVVLLEGVT